MKRNNWMIIFSMITSLIVISLSGCSMTGSGVPEVSDDKFVSTGIWNCTAPAINRPEGNPFILELALNDSGTLVGAISTLDEGSTIATQTFSVSGIWTPSGTLTLTSDISPSTEFDALGENGSVGGKLDGDKLSLQLYLDRTGNTVLTDGQCKIQK